MDRARTPPPLHAEPGGVITSSPPQKQSLNQEGGPRVLRGELSIIRPLPNVAGSAVDRPTFFLLSSVVGDGPRAQSNSTSRRAGRDGYRFHKKKADFESRRRTSGA
jgi:hypothetical protein